MKRFIIFASLVISSIFYITSQEALKSVEEDYYDFLSLTGVVKRPTLGYRTLSDNVWEFNNLENFEENDDGTFTKVITPGSESDSNIWKNNNLGTKYTLFENPYPVNNFLTRGIKQKAEGRLYGIEWFNSWNTEVPFGQNDGALWQGKGYNTSFTTGFRIEGYGFEITFKPQISWSQNQEFPINTNVYPNPYSYSFSNGVYVGHPIDYVQRYGNESLWKFDFGDSEIRWTWHTLTFGAGTQNPWLGPAFLNPMLGSNNAPGYLKLDAGLRKTEVFLPFSKISLGNIEGRIWVGQLVESDYFDDIPWNDKRLVAGLSASYSPSFIPGLSIGLNRVFMTYWRKENLKYIKRLFTLSRSNALASSGNDEDQKFSLFAEWNFPKIGFSVYGEFGRDDFSNDEKSNPFHTAIYTVGAKQVIPLPLAKIFTKLPEVFNLTSELNFEWNNFEMSQDFQMQWTYMGYYAHGFITQGYTNRGQILGAGSGFAGNSQMLQYKVYHPKGFISYRFHRYCPNNNSVYSQSVYTAANPENHLDNAVYQQWYPNFETYISNSFELSFYLFKDFYASFNFAIIKLTHKNYEPSIGVVDKSYHGGFTVKYNF